jgi:hypothetical protein
MSKVIMGVLLKERQETAKEFQELLTEYGSIINTRLGVHKAAENTSSRQGLIIIEFIDDADEGIEKFEKELRGFENITVKKMEF